MDLFREAGLLDSMCNTHVLGWDWQEDGGLTILAASSVHLYDVRVVDLLQQSEF